MIKNDIFGVRPRKVVAPDDYATKKYPVIYVGVGKGENKTNNTPDLQWIDELYANGVPLALARDGILPGYIVLSLQGKDGLAPNPWEVIAATQDVIKTYNGDASLVFIMGLSAGGGLVIDTIAQDKTGVFTAAVEMSTPTAGGDWSNLHCKLVAFHGTADVSPTAFQNSVDAVKNIWKVKPGFAFLHPVPGGGHGGWADIFIPTAKFDFPGFSSPCNIYDLCTQALLTNKLFTASGTENLPTGTIPTTPVSTPLIAVPTVTAKDGLLKLDSSKSTGPIGTFSWSFKAPVAGNGGAWLDGGGAGGKDLPLRTLTGAKLPGVWTLTLTLYGTGGGSVSKDVTITLDATGNTTGATPPVVVIPVTDKLVSSVKIPGSPAVAAIPDRVANTYLKSDGTYRSEVV